MLWCTIVVAKFLITLRVCTINIAIVLFCKADNQKVVTKQT